MLVGFGEEYGLDRDTAVKIARAFGAGMGSGSLCGALAGSFMILGFFVQDETDERQARHRTYDLVARFRARFTELHGSHLCKELLGGVDLGTEQGRRLAKEKDLFSTLCSHYVRDAATILQEMLHSTPIVGS